MLVETEIKRLSDALTLHVERINRTGRGSSPEALQHKSYVEAFDCVMQSGPDPQRIPRIVAKLAGEAPPVIETGKNAAQVSIVIAARNYARFLPEAIQSALAQTVPCEVIYSDDCSLDDSVAVARSYESKGVIVLAGAVHQGVAAARRRGFDVAKGDWFINLDGDDVMPRDYVQKMLAVAGPRTPICYGAAQAFGAGNRLWQAPLWHEASLWVRNFINTSAMYSRAAYYAAGGWQEGVGTMWDWDLALRASRFGIPRRSEAVLGYRLHDDSFSQSLGEREDTTVKTLGPRVRRRVLRLSVGSLLSGRLPGLFPGWLDKLARCVRNLHLPNRVDLVFLVNTDDEEFRSLVTHEVDFHSDTFDTVRIIPFGEKLKWNSEEERRNKVSELLANACNRLKLEMRGDVHWIIEDDMLPPATGAESLLTELVSGLVPPEAVTGVYRNRHAPDRIVGGWWRDGGPQEATQPPNKETRVDFAGTGCLMYWRDRVPDWTSHFKGIPAHDWAWGMALTKRGGKQIMLPQVACGHAVSEKEIIACTPS